MRSNSFFYPADVLLNGIVFDDTGITGPFSFIAIHPLNHVIAQLFTSAMMFKLIKDDEVILHNFFATMFFLGIWIAVLLSVLSIRIFPN